MTILPNTSPWSSVVAIVSSPEIGEKYAMLIDDLGEAYQEGGIQKEITKKHVFFLSVLTTIVLLLL